MKHLDGLGFALEWLNSGQILYEQDGFFQIINVVDNSAENFGSSSYPRYPRSVTSGNSSFISPNYLKLAVYPLVGYNLTGPDGLGDDEDTDNIETGLKIINLNAGTERSFDIDDQFVIGVRWSPSSDKIVVVSVETQLEKENFTISTISLDTGDVDFVGNFNLKYYPELGGFTPTWTPDQTRLAIQTNDGPVVYNLETQTSIGIPTYLEGSLYWSPILNYGAEYQCS